MNIDRSLSVAMHCVTRNSCLVGPSPDRLIDYVTIESRAEVDEALTDVDGINEDSVICDGIGERIDDGRALEPMP